MVSSLNIQVKVKRGSRLGETLIPFSVQLCKGWRRSAKSKKRIVVITSPALLQKLPLHKKPHALQLPKLRQAQIIILSCAFDLLFFFPHATYIKQN